MEPCQCEHGYVQVFQQKSFTHVDCCIWQCLSPCILNLCLVCLLRVCWKESMMTCLSKRSTWLVELRRLHRRLKRWPRTCSRWWSAHLLDLHLVISYVARFTYGLIGSFKHLKQRAGREIPESILNVVWLELVENLWQFPMLSEWEGESIRVA